MINKVFEVEVAGTVESLYQETFMKAKREFLQGAREFLDQIDESEREAVKEVMKKSYSTLLRWSSSFEDIFEQI